MKSNKKKKKRIGGTIKYLVMILVISAVLAGSGILLSNDLFALAKPDKDITVTIPEDATVGEVSITARCSICLPAQFIKTLSSVRVCGRSTPTWTTAPLLTRFV